MGISEADDRYLAEITADCASWLGPGAVLHELRSEPTETGVRLVARYRLEGREHESAGAGESILAAHVALRERMLFDRIGIGLETVVDAR
jgi:hypothetical protein